MDVQWEARGSRRELEERRAERLRPGLATQPRSAPAKRRPLLRLVELRLEHVRRHRCSLRMGGPASPRRADRLQCRVGVAAHDRLEIALVFLDRFLAACAAVAYPRERHPRTGQAVVVGPDVARLDPRKLICGRQVTVARARHRPRRQGRRRSGA